MKKKWMIICCSVLLIGGLSLFLFNQKKQDTNDLMQLVIYPTGTADESYHFVLNKDGILKCSLGTRKNDNIETRDFLKRIVDSSENLLTEHNVQMLIDFANEFEASGYTEEKKIVKDSWNVAFLYNGKTYEMNWDINNSELLEKLVEKFIELSPIPVDLHGWA